MPMMVGMMVSAVMMRSVDNHKSDVFIREPVMNVKLGQGAWVRTEDSTGLRIADSKA
jgi:hypothetical protein